MEPGNGELVLAYYVCLSSFPARRITTTPVMKRCAGLNIYSIWQTVEVNSSFSGKVSTLWCRESDGWSVICKFLDCNAIRFIKVVHTWYLRACITNPIIGKQPRYSQVECPSKNVLMISYDLKGQNINKVLKRGIFYPNSWTIVIFSYPNSSKGAITNSR